jgi:4-diphosphocytidyl-2-C-methyl-D-erythritol kinase
MGRTLTLKAFAKINWTLRVLGKRTDAFHEICTLFQTVSLHDLLHFEEADGLTLTCDDASIPTDQRNLIIQAATLLQETFPEARARGARIHLEKRIPSPGGLGGGSSNAWTAICGLVELWRIPLNDAILAVLPRRLGSDVPFFTMGGTALGTGRGDLVAQVEDREERHVIIVTPDVRVPTDQAYAGLSSPTLTSGDLNRILPVCRADVLSTNPRLSALINDFEPTVFEAHPEIARVKMALLELGAVNAAMSGSGASVFAVFDKEETRQTALKALDQESTWRKFAVSTVSRDEYRESFGI